MAKESVDTSSPREAATPPPPPLPSGPPVGTANIRVKLGFPTHVFVIPGMGLELSQDTWTNVPQEQVSEIVQTAAENQVLLDVEEATA